MAGTDRVPMVFLDRDDTIIVDRTYLADPALVEFLPGVPEGLARLQAAGYRLVVVTNQSGVGRGLITVAQLQAVHARLQEMLGARGVRLFAVRYCPHLPQDNCPCRKPKTGMVADLLPHVDVTRSFMIGDREGDMGFGRGLGVTTILMPPHDRIVTEPDVRVRTFIEAADIVLTRRYAGA